MRGMGLRFCARKMPEKSSARTNSTAAFRARKLSLHGHKKRAKGDPLAREAILARMRQLRFCSLGIIQTNFGQGLRPIMKTALLRTSALIALAIPGAAFAQSTGSVDFEDEGIVVTGSRSDDVGGITVPDTPKAKQVLDEEAIRRARPGQTVNDTVNLVPGVSFQNNDPWGSSGGTFTIRGFSSDRISQTVDGIPLNDSGNYALYTNQQQDPETLESVNVNLGTTDVDSPTASAVGGTINIRTRVPKDEVYLTASITAGDVFAEGRGRSRPYMRGFVMLDSGDFTGIGTKAWASASYTRYDNPFNNYGVVDKQQYNGRIWQDIGSNGDFVAISGHYNQNRPNFFGSFSLPTFPTTKDDRFYNINYPCQLPAGTLAGGGGGSGAQLYNDGATGDCGAEFDRRYNPSNTGNVRGASKFTLMDNLVFTLDASYQYVKANGGGPEDLREGVRTIGGTGYTGFIGGSYYFGRDLNGDGDLLDEVAAIDPSQTQTHRYGAIASLAYELTPEHRLRLAYTYDRARHRQTGTTGFQQVNGEPFDVFPINDPVLDVRGEPVGKRDRLSYAILHQVSGEYRGEFGDLTAVIGARAPFFTRELNQNCFTTTPNAGQGFIDCLPAGQNLAAYLAANPYNPNTASGVPTGYAPPQSRTYKYDDILPNVGFTYRFGAASVFANYAKGLSVPGTDPLYASLYFPANNPNAQPAPETTDSLDVGLRYKSGQIQAQIGAYYTRYKNRLATAFDPVLDQITFRNLGRVDKYGVDGSIAWQPTRNTLLYVFGSYNDSEIKNDIIGGTCSNVANSQPAAFGCTSATRGQDYFFRTGGQSESGSPRFMVGARGQVSFGGFEIGAQAKHYGKRFINDENQPLQTTAGVVLYPASVDSYTLVDLDVRYKIMDGPTGGDVALQLNVTNLFDTLYVSGFGGSLERTSSPFVQIGPPRAASISLLIGY